MHSIFFLQLQTRMLQHPYGFLLASIDKNAMTPYSRATARWRFRHPVDMWPALAPPCHRRLMLLVFYNNSKTIHFGLY